MHTSQKLSFELTDIICQELFENKEAIEDDELHDALIKLLRYNDCLDREDIVTYECKLISTIAAYSPTANNLIGSYLLYALDKCDIDLLTFISKLATFEKLIKKNALNRAMIQTMLRVNIDDLQEFSRQFAENRNEIDYDGILLTCAQRASRKKLYTFNPTVLQSKEFDEYVELVARMQRPLRERFILEAPHRLCGDIWIDAKGKVSILLLDSMGINSSYCEDYRDKLAATFPKALIVMPDTEIQSDGKSCALFALDALFQLFTMEQYLPEEYKKFPAPLHAYIHKNKSTTKLPGKANHADVYACAMPLRMMLNMQSNNLFAHIAARAPAVAALPVNKRKENAYTAAKRHFRNENDIDDNYRVEDKLQSMHTKNMKFICTNDHFRADMLKFTLTAKKDSLVKPKRSLESDASAHKHNRRKC